MHGEHSTRNEIRESIHFLRVNDILVENTNWKMNKTDRLLKRLVLLRICIELNCYYIKSTLQRPLNYPWKKRIKLRWAHLFVKTLFLSGNVWLCSHCFGSGNYSPNLLNLLNDLHFNLHESAIRITAYVGNKKSDRNSIKLYTMANVNFCFAWLEICAMLSIH